MSQGKVTVALDELKRAKAAAAELRYKVDEAYEEVQKTQDDGFARHRAREKHRQLTDRYTEINMHLGKARDKLEHELSRADHALKAAASIDRQMISIADIAEGLGLNAGDVEIRRAAAAAGLDKLLGFKVKEPPLSLEAQLRDEFGSLAGARAA